MQNNERQNLKKRFEHYQPSKTQLVWACVGSVVIAMVVGFTWGGWVTGGTAREMAENAAASDRNAALHVMRTLADLGGETADLERRAVLLTHAKALRHAMLGALDHPRDRVAVESAYRDVKAALSTPRVGAVMTIEPELVDTRLP